MSTGGLVPWLKTGCLILPKCLGEFVSMGAGKGSTNGCLEKGGDGDGDQ
jgi:hypothetical protein